MQQKLRAPFCSLEPKSIDWEALNLIWEFSPLLQITGLGSQFPETKINREVILNGFPELAKSSYFEALADAKRFSSLSAKYLESTANQDISLAKSSSTSSPTDLGYEACMEAIEQAGISPEALGMLVGECPTPDEVTPSEAQRIALSMELKVKAYDCLAGSAAFCQTLSSLLNWKPERIPENYLWVSTGSFSQWINYSSGSAGLFFGDGAGAVCISSNGPGIFSVKVAEYFGLESSNPGVELGINTPIEFNPESFFEHLTASVEQCFQSAIPKLSSASQTKILLNPLLYLVWEELTKRYELEPDSCLNKNYQIVDCIGASPVILLKDQYSQLKKGEEVLIVLSGFGTACGYAILVKN